MHVVYVSHAYEDDLSLIELACLIVVERKYRLCLREPFASGTTFVVLNASRFELSFCAAKMVIEPLDSKRDTDDCIFGHFSPTSHVIPSKSKSNRA
jgi:hypothetical protein